MEKITLPKEIYEMILEYLALENAKISCAMDWSHTQEKCANNKDYPNFYKNNNFDVQMDFARYINGRLNPLHENILKVIETLPERDTILQIISQELLPVHSIVALQNMVEVPN